MTTLNPRYLIAAGISALVALVILSDTLFTVSENQQAIVLQFGAVKRIERTAGLKFKIPFAQNVEIYEKRLLNIASQPQEVILGDQRRLVVDAFAVYRIVDPLKFYQAVRNDDGARLRLNYSLNAILRDVLGNTTVTSMLSKEREGVMQAIRDKAGDAATPLGLTIVDVRISRANFPESISQAIYNQMNTERQREAAQFRAEGAQQATEIRAKADREKTVIVADANRQANILQGEGEAEATRIYAEAYGRDPEFYAFYRSLQAYRTGLSGDTTQLLLSPGSDFLRYMNPQDLPKGLPAR